MAVRRWPATRWSSLTWTALAIRWPSAPMCSWWLARAAYPDAGNVLVFEDADRLPGIAYENIEVVSPNVASGDNLLILGPDMYEQNEYVQTAAYIGSGDALNVENLAIFPNVDEHPGVPADQDYFRFVADTTGIMDFQVYFHVYDHGLLPAGGDIDIDVLDVAGNVIAGAGDFGNHDDTADARVRIPVVAGRPTTCMSSERRKKWSMVTI